MTTTNEDPVEWLERWYRTQCNGDWEHQHGVRIGTLDNPGWSLDVDLVDTPEADRTKRASIIERSTTDWVFCEVKEGVFSARGGPGNLRDVVRAFMDFVGDTSR